MNIFDAAQYEKFWKRTQDPGAGGLSLALARLFLWLLVPLYQGASLLKRAIFASSASFRTRPKALTVSIGNLTMGGTGKTTTARLIGQILSEGLGLETVVLSRGYRSKNKKWVLQASNKGELLVKASHCGDEATLLAKWLPSCSVVVGKRRAITARWAEENLAAQALLLDDGLQYWRLERDVDIICVGAVGGFGNGYLFPRGPLREPLSGLKRAKCIVLYQADIASQEALSNLKSQIREVAPKVPIIQINLKLDELRPTGTLQDKEVYAFCGLGSPQSFQRTLERAGAHVRGMMAFPDHHQYSKDDVKDIAEEAMGEEMVVTTEKDEVNLGELKERFANLYVLPIKPVISDKDRKMLLDIFKAEL